MIKDEFTSGVCSLYLCLLAADSTCIMVVSLSNTALRYMTGLEPLNHYQWSSQADSYPHKTDNLVRFDCNSGQLTGHKAVIFCLMNIIFN